jgi:hypothetical protein
MDAMTQKIGHILDIIHGFPFIGAAGTLVEWMLQAQCIGRSI